MNSVVTVYGIKNCSTVQKSIKWLKEKQFNVELHDFKKEKLSESLVKEWLDSISLEVLINKRGLTWRKLNDEEKAMIDSENVIGLIMTYPTILKRPLVKYKAQWLVGFNEATWQNHLS